MARHKGIPSRARVGFARYFFDGWLIDHEIAEVWDGSAERWRLVEPEIDDGHADPVDGASFDALDVPPDRFLTAPRAWQLARSGAVDPERFVVNPGLEIPATRGLSQLRRNLVRDLAALNKSEMLLWEDWGVLDSHTAPGPGELPVLDELATLTGQPSPPLADLRSAYPSSGVRGIGHRDHIQPRPDRCSGGRRRQGGGPGSQLTGALAILAARDPVASQAQAWLPSHLDRDLTLGTRRASAATWLLSMAQLRWQTPAGNDMFHETGHGTRDTHIRPLSCTLNWRQRLTAPRLEGLSGRTGTSRPSTGRRAGRAAPGCRRRVPCGRGWSGPPWFWTQTRYRSSHC